MKRWRGPHPTGDEPRKASGQPADEVADEAAWIADRQSRDIVAALVSCDLGDACDRDSLQMRQACVFDPDRFAPDRREDRSHRLAFEPFGAGVHKCIGMHFGTLEVKAILHRMLLTHTWTVPEGYEARWDNTSLPVPADGLTLTLTRR